MEYDGITIYEDITYKNKVFEYINDIIHEIYKPVNGCLPDTLSIQLEIFYEDKMLNIELH